MAQVAHKQRRQKKNPRGCPECVLAFGSAGVTPAGQPPGRRRYNHGSRRPGHCLDLRTRYSPVETVLISPWLDEKKSAPKRAQVSRRKRSSQTTVFSRTNQICVQSHRPNPADCIDCFEMSDVEAIPCIRSLNSSAFEALSNAVS